MSFRTCCGILSGYDLVLVGRSALTIIFTEWMYTRDLVRCQQTLARVVFHAAYGSGRPQRWPLSARVRARSQRCASAGRGLGRWRCASAGRRAADGSAVGVLGVVEHELAQRPEVSLDRVGPRIVGRGEAQLDFVVLCPLAHGAALVSREVVEDHIDPLAVVVAGPDRLERGQ